MKTVFNLTLRELTNLVGDSDTKQVKRTLEKIISTGVVVLDRPTTTIEPSPGGRHTVVRGVPVDVVSRRLPMTLRADLGRVQEVLSKDPGRRVGQAVELCLGTCPANVSRHEDAGYDGAGRSKVPNPSTRYRNMKLRNRNRNIEIRKILLEDLIEDPGQPRKANIRLDALARSLDLVGQTTPILVTQKTKPDIYMVVDGWRRCSAARKLGWEAMDCVVMDVTDEERRDVQFNVDFFHLHLNAFERAEEVAKIKERYGWSDQRVAAYLGRPRSEVSSILKLREIPDDIKDRLQPACSDLAMDSLYQVARAVDRDQMEELVHLLLHDGTTDDLRAARRAQKQRVEAAKKIKVGGMTKTAGGRSRRDQSPEVDPAPDMFMAEPEEPTVPERVKSCVESVAPTDEREIRDESKDVDGNVEGDCVVTIVESEAVRESPPPNPDSAKTQIAPSAVSPTATQRTIDEWIVERWWESFTVHAVRVTQLRAVANEASMGGLDVPAWLERVKGTVIGGYTVVVVPVVQDKRVYQLVPERLSRPSYVDQMQAQLLEMNEKLRKKH